MERPPLGAYIPGVRWNWIIDPANDLLWYIGSALAGWFYIALILFIGSGLSDPLRAPFYTLDLGGCSIPFTLELAVFASWAYLVDSPHLWATLARTYLDPDEWSLRRRELLFSLVWFVVGPVAVVAPYLVASVWSMEQKTMALGGQLFFAFFRLWAYYHVVRQHWGFLVLYKRKNGDLSDSTENRADSWFFELSLYLPLLIFITSPGSLGSGFLDIELASWAVDSWVTTGLVHRLSLVVYGVTVGAYLTFQLVRLRYGVPRNGPKLLFLLAIVPLHFVVFFHPLLALFAVPIVTVGHNLQYHRIVWMYGRNKYAADMAGRYRLAQPVFRHVSLYLLLGAAFTFALSRGPWVEFVGDQAALYFDRWIFPAVGILAGITNPASAGVGAEVVALFLTGWSMHHYYLDAKIWRVSRDSTLSKPLNL